MKENKNMVKELLPYILIIIIVFVIKIFIVTPIRVNGPSMNKTLKNKDIMLLDKISYRFTKIKRFDIVVVKYNDEYIIKRVIGLPGEKIEYINNKLYINGKKVKEKFNHAETYDFSTEQLKASKVPKNSYFVLGDNRINSTDSRIIGYVDKNNILGHARFTLFPFNRFGTKK